MSRNASHRSDIAEGPTIVSPNWTKNEKYCVTRLPGRPSQIDNLAQYRISAYSSTDIARINGTVSGDSSYALISTPESVYVWPYTIQHPDPLVLTFPIRSTEPPLASFVSPNAGSHEPGLVLVKPTNGQIAYWDAVGSAVAEGLIQRAGVQATLPIVQGETATYLCNAEPAGFIVATSKGGLWNVQVRDTEGRPHLSFVAMTSTGGAWFSGLRSFIAGGLGRTDVVAVKPGVQDGSERRAVYVATKRGVLEKWELARGGSYRLSGHGDISAQLHEKLQEQLSDSQVSVVDIAAVPSSFGASDQLVILTSCSVRDTSRHAIFLFTFPDHQPPQISSGALLPPSPSEYSSLRPTSPSQPQIYVPFPGRTAFIAFSRGFDIVSLPNGVDDWSYRDTVTFRDDQTNLRIIASGQEDLTTDRTSHRKLRNPGMSIVIQGAGVARVETFDHELGDKKLATSGLDWIQSKVEQAIIYGVSLENPLEFKPRQEWSWKLHEVETVATKISKEILTASMQPGNLADHSIKVYAIVNAIG
jgi:nuclear pore complex protein Nup133